MAKQTMIDPDSGWRYGFPKVLDNPKNIDLDLWLVLNGYPVNLAKMWIDSEFGSIPCRMWEI